MIPFFNSYYNVFDWEENYWDLNILCEKQFLEQIVQISVILTDTGCKICPKFVGVKRQNKIQQTYDHNCK